MINILISSLIACGEVEPEPLFLTKELYEWNCYDFEEYSEIIVTTETCETKETGLHFLIAEYQLIGGFNQKANMIKPIPDDCFWETSFILIDPVCIEVEGVTLTAYVEPATWSGTLFGD
jgi:hypothetical protein